jgi:hypothetical protein
VKAFKQDAPRTDSLILRCVETTSDKSKQPPSVSGIVVSTTRDQLAAALYVAAKEDEEAAYNKTEKGKASVAVSSKTKHTLSNGLLMQTKTGKSTKTLNGVVICTVLDERGNSITSIEDEDGGYLVEPTDDAREGFKIYLGCTLCTWHDFHVASQPPTLSAFDPHLNKHKTKPEFHLSHASSEQSAQLLAATLSGPLKENLQSLKRKAAVDGGHSTSKRPVIDQSKLRVWRKEHLLIIQRLFARESKAYLTGKYFSLLVAANPYRPKCTTGFVVKKNLT